MQSSPDDIRRQTANQVSFVELFERHRVVALGELHSDPTARNILLGQLRDLVDARLLDEIVLAIPPSRGLHRANVGDAMTAAEIGAETGLTGSDLVHLISAATSLDIPISGGDTWTRNQSVASQSPDEEQAIVARTNEQLATNVAHAARDGRRVLLIADVSQLTEDRSYPGVRTVDATLLEHDADVVKVLPTGGWSSFATRGLRPEIDAHVEAVRSAQVADETFQFGSGDAIFLNRRTTELTNLQTRTLLDARGAMNAERLAITRVPDVYADILASDPATGWRLVGTALARAHLFQGAAVAFREGSHYDRSQLLDAARCYSELGLEEKAGAFIRQAVLDEVAGATEIAMTHHRAIGDQSTVIALARTLQGEMESGRAQLRHSQHQAGYSDLQRRTPADTGVEDVAAAIAKDIPQNEMNSATSAEGVRVEGDTSQARSPDRPPTRRPGPRRPIELTPNETGSSGRQSRPGSRPPSVLGIVPSTEVDEAGRSHGSQIASHDDEIGLESDHDPSTPSSAATDTTSRAAESSRTPESPDL